MSILNYTKEHPCPIIFIFFILLNIIIFRVPLTHTPQIMEGTEVLSAEELVPIFNFKTQFTDLLLNNYSDLTSDNTSRLRYSFYTSWVRYYAILPIALVILNAISAFILFYAAFLFANFVSKKEISKSNIIYGALISSTIIYLILLYSKITHFYTLIFGFGLFCLALAFFLRGLFSKETNIKDLVISSVLILINPGVHYHVISLLVITWFLLVYFFLQSKKGNILYFLKKAALIFIIVLVISTVPYYFFVNWFILSPNQQIEIEIPVTYTSIIGFQPPNITIFLSSDTAAQIDNFLTGSYIKQEPRILNILYFIFLFLPLLFYKKLVKNPIIILLLSTVILSMYFSLGYLESLTFYNNLENISHNLYLFFPPILSFFYTIVQVLRFPHRFQFIYFACFLFLISFYTALILNSKIKKTGLKFLKGLFVISLFVLFLNSDISFVLFSGNFAGFLQPYSISKDMIEIKDILDSDTTNYKILILPSTMGGLQVNSEGNKLNLNDKFFIYYFNKPSIDYVTTGDIKNRASMYIAYRAFQFSDSFWLNEIENIGVKYIILNKETSPRQRGIVYLPGIEKKIRSALINSKKVDIIYDGKNFALFELNNFKEKKECNIFVNLSWQNYLKYSKETDDKYEACKLYRTFDLDDLDKLDLIVTDNKQKLVYDLASIENNKKNFFTVDSTIIPFSKEYASTLSYPSLFSLFSLLSINKWNNFGLSIPGFFDTITAKVSGSKESFTFKIPFKILEDEKYQLYLRGKTTSNLLFINVKNSLGQSFNKSSLETGDEIKTINEYSYYPLGELFLNQGDYTLEIEKQDLNPIVLEGLLIITNEDLEKIEIYTTNIEMEEYNVYI